MNHDIVYALAAPLDAAGLCFAARHSGLWRSDDGGTTWEPTGHAPGLNESLPVTSVAVSPNFLSDGSVFAGVPGGILSSIDGGKQWTVVALPSPPPFVSALAMSPSYELDGVVFATTLEDGVFRSTDRGMTWETWNFGLFDLNILSIAVSPRFAHDRTVYVGTETGIFCSKNSGCAWSETGFPTDFAPVLSLAISPQFAQDGILYAGTESSGLFYSDNKGQTWQCVLVSEAINTVLISLSFPTIADILAVSNDTLWLSRDGGRSWSKNNPDKTFGAGFTAAVVPGGPASESLLLLGLSDGRVLRT